MDPETTKVKEILTSFLNLFNEYAKEIFGKETNGDNLDNLRTQLQLREPIVTKYLLEILGNGTFVVGSFGQRSTISRRDFLATALMGSNNELPINFRDYNDPTTAIINRAIGTIEQGLWPQKQPKPVLEIKDKELRNRTQDLLSASDNYDRVLREATTILEDRIRNKCPHDLLSNLIPQSSDQTSEHLINKLFNPEKPIIYYSDDKNKRLSIFKILIGIFAYVRNPNHHRLDPAIEWSWAWSIVGLTDRLLSDIEDCTIKQ